MRLSAWLRLGAVSSATMTIATFPLIIFSVLAAELISEFGITRGQVGFLVTANGLVGALASPYFGGLTDRIGAVTSTKAVFAVGIVILLGMAASPVYGILLAAALVAGISHGWGNPATNALIVENVPPGSRGLLTGVKQSGVQVGTFLGGLLLPLFTAIWNWRVAVAIFVLIPAAGWLGLRGNTYGPYQRAEAHPGVSLVPVAVRWIAVYGALSGMATSALFTFLPLFAEEVKLWSPQAAGSLIALVGLVGVVARIAWPPISERGLGHGRALRIIGVFSTLSAVLLLLAAAGVLSGWVLVPAALLLAVGSISWNSVGMLAVMDLSHPAGVGKGTGLVLLGFLLGYAVGAPLMGASVDSLGTYVPGWVAAATMLVASALVAGRVPAGSTLARS